MKGDQELPKLERAATGGTWKKQFLENMKQEFDFDLEKYSFGPEQKNFGPGKQETGFDLEKQEVQVGPQVHLDPNWLPDIGWILFLHPVFMIYLQSHCFNLAARIGPGVIVDREASA